MKNGLLMYSFWKRRQEPAAVKSREAVGNFRGKPRWHRAPVTARWWRHCRSNHGKQKKQCVDWCKLYRGKQICSVNLNIWMVSVAVKPSSDNLDHKYDMTSHWQMTSCRKEFLGLGIWRHTFFAIDWIIFPCARLWVLMYGKNSCFFRSCQRWTHRMSK